MNVSRRSTLLRWAVGGGVLALLAWQGHHLAQWLPRFDRTIEQLGPWGPVVYILALLLLEPLLVPHPLFGLAAGAAFGLVAGAVYDFAGVYLMCLVVHWLGNHWLKTRVVHMLETRPKVARVVEAAPGGGVRFTFLVRLLPISPAVLSYALGAAGVPLRTAMVGNVAMFTHMLPSVYFGAAAVHVTRMAGTGHQRWETDGVLLLAGLAVCAAVAARISHRASAAVGAEHDGPALPAFAGREPPPHK